MRNQSIIVRKKNKVKNRSLDKAELREGERRGRASRGRTRERERERVIPCESGQYAGDRSGVHTRRALVLVTQASKRGVTRLPFPRYVALGGGGTRGSCPPKALRAGVKGSGYARFLSSASHDYHLSPVFITLPCRKIFKSVLIFENK